MEFVGKAVLHLKISSQAVSMKVVRSYIPEGPFVVNIKGVMLNLQTSHGLVVAGGACLRLKKVR